MKSVDLNCDMGESTALREVGDDLQIMPLVSSANIACGYHGGNPEVMRKTISLAMQHGVALGAHPSFPDPEHFGRKEMVMADKEVFQLVKHQLELINSIAAGVGTRITHVKPHGALYNMAARHAGYAAAVVAAVKSVDPGLVLFGLSGSLLVSSAADAGLKVCSEVFADRTYQDNGSLTSRSHHNSMISDVQEAVLQVVTMVCDGRVRSVNGHWIDIHADTICIHGDTPGAADYARAIRHGLEAAGVTIQSYLKS